jgi:hypothetical protein
MQVWRLLYTNLVGPRGEKLESTKPFWCFYLFTSKWEVHMSFPRELCSCRGCSKGGSMDTIHLWGCNKGGSSKSTSETNLQIGISLSEWFCSSNQMRWIPTWLPIQAKAKTPMVPCPSSRIGFSHSGSAIQITEFGLCFPAWQITKEDNSDRVSAC